MLTNDIYVDFGIGCFHCYGLGVIMLSPTAVEPCPYCKEEEGENND